MTEMSSSNPVYSGCPCCSKAILQLFLKNSLFLLINEVKDKRLLCNSKVYQPTHLRFGREFAAKLLRIINASPKDNSLRGYNPSRGDIDTPHNIKAESSAVLASQLSIFCYEDINKNINTEKSLIENLQIALVEQFTSKLKEKECRKNIIKQHGLMNQKGTGLWFSRLEASVGKSQAKRIIRLCPLMSAYEMDLLLNSLGWVNKKRAQVNKLTFYRTQRGITAKWDMDIFERQRLLREENNERIDVRNLAVPLVKKKKPGLEIFHLPRFEELTPKECDLCSSIALEPSFYLDIKDFLISECKRNNGLLLKKARKLVKIDVNKTRKIFDLLLEEGYTWLPVPGSPLV